MNESLLNQLLYADEGNSLDFKRDQYPFNNQPNDIKSELLKDILAFANSWRRETAYILIGIEEKKGGKNIVIGVSSHLEDSNLQEFVNSKTNKPISFSYKTFKSENKSIGIIEIPVQKRPFYLTKDFGKLKNGTVYLKRGSSTAIAQPSEVAEMGISENSDEKMPDLEVWIGDVSTENIFNDDHIFHSTLLNIPPKTDLVFKTKYPFGVGIDKSDEYYWEYAEYLRINALLNEISFKLINRGDIPLKSGQIKFEIPINEKLPILLKSDRVDKPSKSNYLITNINQDFIYPNYIEQKNDSWRVTLDIGDIQPKEEVWSSSIFFGVFRKCSISFGIKVFADNLPNPKKQNFKLNFKIKEGVFSRNEILQLANNA